MTVYYTHPTTEPVDDKHYACCWCGKSHPKNQPFIAWDWWVCGTCFREDVECPPKGTDK